tara:strand:- start:85710 stop:86303 length:594 start_codon:yes stop_codon:yes gene_type:complete
MVKIGITGGIGSGKSIVSSFFLEWGAYVFDADKEAKIILNENETAQSEVIAEFGTNILGPNNEIEKKKLSKIVFQDESHLLRLNTIVHPYIFDEIDRRLEIISAQRKYDLFVLDAALIYESGAETHMDYIIVVTSKVGLRTERVMERGGLTREEFLKRVSLQWPDEEKVKLADFIIENNGSRGSVKKDAQAIFKKLI